ncbi:MAG: TrkA family potassium uptake protein [Desulfobacterota bacterium]|nr:TrkA family potassium uptake protein [Thermodesulfobacteriota bacterium]
MKNFAVIGLGNFGFFIARFLAERGCSVLAIDSQEAQIERIKPFVDKAVIADASNKEVLERIGVQDMDAAIVSVGERVDTSVLITLYLKELKVPQIIAKAISEDHGKILHIVGATDVVFPERDVAAKIAETLANPNILDTLSLGPEYSMVQLVPPPQFLHKTLRELDIRNRYNVQVIAVKEYVPENIIAVPHANYTIKDSDVLLVIGKQDDIEKLRKLS